MGEALVSTRNSQERIVIDPNALIAQAQELGQVIENLRNLLANLSLRKESIRKAKETIEAIAECKEPVLIPADPEGLVFYESQPVSKEKFLVHLGLDVYAALGKEDVLEKLAQKESEIDKEISIISERREEARKQYEAIQALLQQIAVQQAQYMRQSSQKEK